MAFMMHSNITIIYSVFATSYKLVCDDVNVSVQACVSYYTCLLTQGGDSALIKASWIGNIEVVVELIKAGAHLNLQNKVQRQDMVMIFCMNMCSAKLVGVSNS